MNVCRAEQAAAALSNLAPGEPVQRRYVLQAVRVRRSAMVAHESCDEVLPAMKPVGSAGNRRRGIHQQFRVRKLLCTTNRGNAVRRTVSLEDIKCVILRRQGSS